MARDLSSYNVCNLQLAIDLVGEDNSWNLSQENEDASSYSVEDTNSNATDSDYDSVDGGKKIARKKGKSLTMKPLSSFCVIPAGVLLIFNLFVPPRQHIYKAPVTAVSD